MARVAIVMPAFEAEDEIRHAIDSVLAQTYSDWQLIVVDDGSTDGTADVARSVSDPRIAVVTLEHTGLPAAARNAGISATGSEFVAFLDADDVWEPTKLELQVALMDARPEVGLVYSYADHLVDGERRRVDWEPLGDDAFAQLSGGNALYNSTVILRRALLEQFGLLDEDPRLRGTEDYALWLRLAGRTEFACVPERLLLYRVRPDGLGRDGLRMAAGVLIALEKELAASPGRFERLGPTFLREYGIRRFLNGFPGAGRPELLAALRLDRGDPRTLKWLALSLLGRRIVRALVAWKIRRATSAAA